MKLFGNFVITILKLRKTVSNQGLQIDKIAGLSIGQPNCALRIPATVRGEADFSKNLPTKKCAAA